MPSSPYAASAAATPIASAKRPKRRANQGINSASPVVRRTALGGDNAANAKMKGSNDRTAAGIITPQDGSSSVVGGGDASSIATTTTTPLGKRTEEGQGPEAADEGPESPSPTKARKGSMSASPRTGGLGVDSRSPPQQQQQQDEGKKGPKRSVGGAAGAEGRGLGGDHHDPNRHSPQESSIFSPALNQSHGEARDQAPASTVGAASAVAAAAAAASTTTAQSPAVTTAATTVAAEKRSTSDDVNVDVDDASAAHAETISSASSSCTVAEPLSKKGRTAASHGGKAAVSAPTAGKQSSDGAAEKSESGGAGDDDAAPDLVNRGVSGERVDKVVEEEEEEDEEEEEFNPYCFIAHLPPYNTVKHHTPLAPALPEKRKTRHGKELTLVLDLDETLVHCTVDPIVNPDHRFEVHFNGEEFQVYVRKRPHLDEFLEAVSELFEVVVFTASQQVYAERLLNMIDPQKKFVKYRLYRDACMALEGNYLKDLNVLGRDLSKVAIVDNSPYAYGFQIDNGIPIESWFDDKSDEELLHLLPLLKQLISESEIAGGDVRPFIRNIFKTHELVDKARNGSHDKDVGSPLHYPALTPATSSQSRGAGEKRDARKAAAVSAKGSNPKDDTPANAAAAE